MQPQHVAAQTLLRTERAGARSVKKQRVRLQASMPADVGRALRYAGGFAPARRPNPIDSDISKWQKR